VYAAPGVSFGLKYNLFSQHRLFVDAQVHYRLLFKSHDLSIGYNNDSSIVTYSVRSSQSILPGIGINYRLHENEAGDPEDVISLTVNYHLPFDTVTAAYVSGDSSEEIRAIINRRYQPGIGFAVSYSIYF
jgi:hypothetical protein